MRDRFLRLREFWYRELGNRLIVPLFVLVLVLVLLLARSLINVEPFVVKHWFCHLRPFEYEYRFTEYEYE
jgi:hypothetical protein